MEWWARGGGGTKWENNERDIDKGSHYRVREKSGVREIPKIHKDDLSEDF